MNDKEAAAVVDTAAEVTMLSKDVFNAMNVKPRKVKDVRLLVAGKKIMNGFVVGPVKSKKCSKIHRTHSCCTKYPGDVAWLSYFAQ